MAVLLTASPLHRSGQRVALGVLIMLLISWWGPGFAELDPAAAGVREQDQFRAISQRTDGERDRYSPRARLFNLSDQMELAMGRITAPVFPWGDRDELRERLLRSALPDELWLASSGPPQKLNRKLKPLQRQAEAAGYVCDDRSEGLSHGRLLRCRSGSTAPRP